MTARKKYLKTKDKTVGGEAAWSMRMVQGRDRLGKVGASKAVRQNRTPGRD